MDTLVLKLEILKLSFKPVLGLLSAGNLLVEGFNGLLSLSQADWKLLFATLELIDAAKTLSLKLGSPELNLSLSLGESLECIRLLLRLFLNALPQILELEIIFSSFLTVFDDTVFNMDKSITV